MVYCRAIKGTRNTNKYHAIKKNGQNSIYRIGSPSMKSIRLSQDGQILQFVSMQSSVKLFNTETGKLLRTLTKGGQSAEFSPEGRFIVTTDGFKVSLWKANDGHLITEFKPPKGFAEQALFSPDGKQILTIGKVDTRYPQRIVMLWDLYSTIETENPNTDAL